MNHARVLLRANDGWADQEIQEALDVSIPTIQRVRYRSIEQSLKRRSVLAQRDESMNVSWMECKESLWDLDYKEITRAIASYF